MDTQRTYDGRNRRADVKMTPAEISEFLSTGPDVMALGTINGDGSIHLATVSVAFVDGVIWTKSKARAQKAVNLRRHPFASCMLSEGDDDYETMHGLYARGPVTIFDDHDTVLRVTNYIASRYEMHRSGGVPDPAAVERLTTGYVAIRFDDPTFVTWDHRKLLDPR